MSVSVTSELIHAALRKMQGDMSELKSDVRDLKVRDRIERIETGLDLTEQR